MDMSRKQARQRVLELLKEVGIPSPETKIDAYLTSFRVVSSNVS